MKEDFVAEVEANGAGEGAGPRWPEADWSILGRITGFLVPVTLAVPLFAFAR